MAKRLALILSVLAVVGCDRPSTSGDGGPDGVDAASSDAGPRDAGSEDDAGPNPEPDASTPGDAGSPPDAGPPDAGPEPCDTPGATENVPCGMCGTVERFCQASSTWAYGACTGEGECAPGTIETTACGSCGSQQRRCTTACAWETVGTCAGEGECAPGTMVTTQDGCPSDQARQLLCNDACAFEVTSACAAETCTTPGATEELLPCGTMCGTRDRFCTSAHLWEYGACTGEGVCVPGTTGTLPCGMCGTRAARCTTECGWTPVAGSVCTGEGVCTPGARQRTTMGCTGGQTRLVECDASCGYTIEIEPCRTSVPIDVLFLVDATGSNWSEFSSERAAFVASCVDPLLAITDVSVGLAYYGDFGSLPETFVGVVELGPATSAAISTSIAGESGFGGADDSTMEALHILTGGTPQPGAVPFTCSAGRVAGGCWRPGAERVIVMHTDEVAKGGPDPASTGLYSPWPTGPTWTTVLPRLMTDDTSMFVIYDEDDALGTAQYREMIADLGQPASDYHQQGGTSSITTFCSAIVARVRTMAGM
jgi:hypothetical protein